MLGCTQGLHLIEQYINGDNNHAYKVYKFLNAMPTENLFNHDKSFITTMEHLLYSPGGCGAVFAAEEFRQIAYGDVEHAHS
jgi:hypothetical protein